MTSPYAIEQQRIWNFAGGLAVWVNRKTRLVAYSYSEQPTPQPITRSDAAKMLRTFRAAVRKSIRKEATC